jgi:sarcosine oxidase, subunit beta
MAQSADVIIIGGGITGTAAAYELARAGTSVILLEKGNLAAMGSGRTLAGVRQSGRHPAEMPLAMAAVARWPGLGDELGADLEYRQRGNLRLAEDEDDTHIIKRIVREQRDLGLEIHYLNGNSAVRDIAPALSERIVAASYTPTDGHANPIATVQAYARAATRAGARIQEQTTVTEITVQSSRATGVSPAPTRTVARPASMARTLMPDLPARSRGPDGRPSRAGCSGVQPPAAFK